MITLPWVGAVRALQLLVEPDLMLRLFTNDHLPADADTLASYVEMVGAGYAPKPLRAPDWTVIPGPLSEARAPRQLWTFTAASPTGIVGYYLTEADRLRWAERFEDGPYPVREAGVAVLVVPRVYLRGDMR